jgi:hypothetical protein
LGFGVYVHGLGQCWAFLFCFCKLPILVIKKAFKNHTNSIFSNFNFKKNLGFGVYVYGLG